MILNKKGLAVLPLAALLFSCQNWKTLSFDDAIQFVKDTYGQSTETTRTIKKTISDFKGKANNDAAKEALKSVAKEYFLLDLDDSLTFHYVDEEQHDQPILTPEMFEQSFYYVKDTATFSTKGKELKISQVNEIDFGKEKISMTQELIYNGDGFSTGMTGSGSYKDSDIEFSYEFSNKLEY